ncbi:MAG: hypothetical protein ACOYML_04810 [Microthrixaceae bacterium]
MADAPFDGIYGSAWRRITVERFDDLVELIGAEPGPAGIALVEFPDGSAWAVDFADPESLVSLAIPDGSIPDSPLVIALFGGDGAMFLADPDAAVELRDDRSDEIGPHVSRPQRWARVRGRSRPQPGGEPSSIAGLMVLLADRTTDDEAEPIVRLAAIAELVRVLPNVPGSALIAPLVEAYLDEIDRLAADTIEGSAIESLSGASAGELRDLLVPLADPAPGHTVVAPALRELLDRLRDRATRGDDLVVAMASPRLSAAPSPASEGPPGDRREIACFDEPEPVLTQLLEVERVGEMLIEVRMALTVWANWARVVRTSDLVTVALVPLEEREHLRVGRGVIPPDLDLDDVEVMFGTLSDLVDDRAGLDADEVLRNAIRLGRSASRAARSGDPYRAQQLWGDCEAAWLALGDQNRAGLANEYRHRALGRQGRIGPPLLAERITEELESGEFD